MIVKNAFGTTSKGEAIDVYTIRNSSGAAVDILTYGATVNSIYVADKNGAFCTDAFNTYVFGIYRIRQKANGYYNTCQYRRYYYPERRLFIAQNRPYSRFYIGLTEGKRTSGDHSPVNAAGKECFGIIGPRIAVKTFDHPFIASKLDVAAKHKISNPHKGIKPMYRQNKESERLPQMVLSIYVRLLVGNNVPHIFFAYIKRNVYFRPDKAENEGGYYGFTLVDVVAEQYGGSDHALNLHIAYEGI